MPRDRLKLRTNFTVILGIMLSHTAFAENWHVETAANPLTHEKTCLLMSNVQKTSDGYGETPVTLLFDGHLLLVRTESGLDKSFKDLRLAVDEKSEFKSERIERDKLLIFDQTAPDLVQAFRKGYKATVFLRFWPTYPATRSYPVSFDLTGFSKAQDSLPDCGSTSGAN